MGTIKVAIVVLVLLAFGAFLIVVSAPWFWPAP